MVARVNTVAFHGIRVMDVDVQVQMAPGLPTFTVVGLPDKAVTESRERVRAALTAMGLALPPKRITVNLAPADLVKEGSHFDLPIALGLLADMGVLPGDEIAGYAALGELALDGALSPVTGVLPAAIHAGSRDLGLICPAGQGPEAAWAGDLDILAPSSLLALINHFKGTQVLTAPEARLAEDEPALPDMAEIKGQETAKRALEIAAAGAHNLLMVGPPGSGKSMLAARLPGLLPPLDAAETLEASMIHSLAGSLGAEGLIRRRPFRDPHHSASMAALVGGGRRARPGEVSLAHLGVLFLDELPEFQRAAVNALRQPMEAGYTTVARANAHVTYPSRFQLIAAMNPCRCGFLGDPAQACTRAPGCAMEYQSKISGHESRVRPHRPARGSARRQSRRPDPAAAGRGQRRNRGSRRRRPRPAEGKIRRARGRACAHQRRGRRGVAGTGGGPRRGRQKPAGGSRRAHAADGQGLSPGAARGQDARRPGRRRRRGPHPYRRGPDPPPRRARPPGRHDGRVRAGGV